MKENEEHLSGDEQKARIRQRYKGISTDELDVIPAIPQTNFYEDRKEKRVAVYARVSTDDPRQTSSYELQKNHYQDVVSRHPGWQLQEIYADEGISGTSLQHRDSFVRMINDCYAGKIDLIVTKSVSRFARNVLDCIGYVRKLAALHPPIGIFFETENIYTLNSNSEMSLSFISTLAQEESHNKSEIMNASIEMRFRRGIFLTPPLIGYDQDENGNLIINEEEAKTVRLIFFMYLYGYSTQQIADTLMELERKTKKGNIKWSSGTVLGVLQNERHCGDVLARKTWTPSYLDHKSKKNRQDRNQYRQKNHHDAIISRDDFIAVQRMIRNAKYGNKDMMPDLSVIVSGRLRGFVIVHPRWAGFKPEDYRRASASAFDEIADNSNQSDGINGPQNGRFDMRGFEIARGEFFESSNGPLIIFNSRSVRCNTECLRRLDSDFAEILVNPSKQEIALRAAEKDNHSALRICTRQNGKRIPKITGGTAFLPVLFQLFGWNAENEYRIHGTKEQTGGKNVVVFSLSETEIVFKTVEVSATEDNDGQMELGFDKEMKPVARKNGIVGYPENWASSFGKDYYQHSSNCPRKGDAVQEEPLKEIAFKTEQELKTTDHKEIHESINTMIQDMTQDKTKEAEK